MNFISFRKARVLVPAVFTVIGVALVLYFLKERSSLIRVKPRIGPVVEAVYGLGTVVAPQTYQVKTAVNQRITDLFVKEGDQVKGGQALIRFDDSGIAHAPFAGTVTSVPMKKGELVFSSTPALTLVNLSDLIIEVSLEQQAILRVKRDQKAAVSFESIRGDRIEGKVQAVFPRESQFIVRILIDKMPAGILPGMTADVAIEVGHKENVLSIPMRALSSGKVTLRRSGKVLKESIQVGVVDGEWAEVTSKNIEASDEILVRSK